MGESESERERERESETHFAVGEDEEVVLDGGLGSECGEEFLERGQEGCVEHGSAEGGESVDDLRDVRLVLERGADEVVARVVGEGGERDRVAAFRVQDLFDDEVDAFLGVVHPRPPALRGARHGVRDVDDEMSVYALGGRGGLEVDVELFERVGGVASVAAEQGVEVGVREAVPSRGARQARLDLETLRRVVRVAARVEPGVHLGLRDASVSALGDAERL